MTDVSHNIVHKFHIHTCFTYFYVAYAMLQAISDSRQRHQSAGPAGKRGKSPFAIFKKTKSRDQSPMRPEDMMQGPGGTLPVHITVGGPGRSID